ncbi:metallophosphoesterase [Desulfosudis oleivorans]|uniref:metallophosphoesterase n=1 Tax=Desulfosudis oleivorans TaxID=181663 RepID=UPI0002EEE2C8|nr:metallophosphoesterase [Desulfosudis oleivorans]
MESNAYHSTRRKSPKQRQIRLAVLFFLLLLSIPWACPVWAGQNFQGLWCSDIHFDPFFDPAIVPELNRRPEKEWPSILAGSPLQGRLPKAGEQTGLALLESTLQAMRARLARPEFIICSGDFLAHGFNEKYAAITGEKNPAACSAFIDKTLSFLVSRFTFYFPDAPVLFSLGNTDSYEGDYRATAHSPFFKASAPLLGQAFLKTGQDEKTFAATYRQGGYFETRLLGRKNLRVFSLNTTFFSRKTSKAGPGPAAEQLAWLEDRIDHAARRKEKVWVLMHIPPGISVYSTLQKNPGRAVPKKPVLLLNQTYLAPLKQILTRYPDTVAALFAGHIHRNDFRLLRTDAGPPAVVLVTAAVSPVFDNNPVFRVVTVDPAGFTIAGMEEWFLDLLTGKWQRGAAWGPRPLTGKTLHRFWQEMKDTPALADRYMAAYNGFAKPDAITGQTFAFYHAAMGALDAPGYQQALEGWFLPDTPPPADVMTVPAGPD